MSEKLKEVDKNVKDVDGRWQVVDGERQKTKKERGGKTMKRILMVMGLMVVMSGVVMAGSTDTVNINLLVTPVTTANLNVDTTYYNFGNVAVGVTTCSISALVLSNAGSVGVTVEKAVWDDDDWYVSDETTETNGFDLWAMTNASEPGTAAYTTGNTHNFDESALQAFNNLTDSAGDQVALNPEVSANLWFRETYWPCSG